MSDEELDSEKTQIFLPGGERPAPRTGAAQGDREGIRLDRPAQDTTEHSAATNVDFDITTGTSVSADANADAVDPATSRPAAAERVTTAAPAPAPSSGWPVWIVVVIAIAAIVGYVALR